MGYHNKLPHHYANEYIKARGDPVKQKAVIDSAPVHWLPIIKTHIRNQKDWARYDNKVNKNRPAARSGGQVHTKPETSFQR